MLAAAGIVAFRSPGLIQQIMTALALAVALVLDTADGRLARLQGTSSPFGRWLDHVLDELCDLALHAAIAWSMFQTSRQAWWLVVGILYASGKYVFLIQSVAGAALDEELKRNGKMPDEPRASAARREPRPPGALPGTQAARRLVRAVGHADIRWHLWIVLGLVGRLDQALLVYAVYYPLRALGGALRKAVAHA
jgi:hypothetical protein